MFKVAEINSIRHRMITGFLFLTLLILLLAWISLSSIDKTTQISRMHEKISQLQIHTLSLIKTDNDFVDLETVGDSYFISHTSQHLLRHDSLINLIKAGLQEIMQDKKMKEESLMKRLIRIDSMLSVYQLKFKRLEELVFKKGFKDYGIEGQMRMHAHMIEGAINGPDALNLLYLRRHEKDFLLRHDTTYLTLFFNRANLLLNKGDLDKLTPDRASIRYHLNEYTQLFAELANVSIELGLFSRHGLRNELNLLTDIISDEYATLTSQSKENTEIAYGEVRLIFIFVLTGALLFSVLSGIWIARRLADPIEGLSKAMQSSIQSGGIIKPIVNIRNSASEVSDLASSFSILMDQIQVEISKHKKKSKLLKKRNAELKKLNIELDNFLYSTAHDLRSPLSSLLGLINLLRKENNPTERFFYIDMMEKSIQRSENFISQIVNYSKNKRLGVVPEQLGMATLIAEVFEDHRYMEGAERIKRIVTVNDTIPFFSDRRRIIILLNNLISNAIKYSDPKKEESIIKIQFNLENDNAFLEFCDNGIGVSNDQIDKIFDMFYRAHSHSKGSGLGLFIFKETIDRLQGVVQVESTVNIGTKFIIRLPNLASQFMEHEALQFQKI